MDAELTPYLLSNVRLTGTRIGGGAYGNVDEVEIPVSAAAKRIHDVFLDSSGPDIPKAVTEFMMECSLLSTLHHPNIVQFLGVCNFPRSRLPALVMERLLISLHDLLNPESPPPPGTPRPVSFFKIGLKCSVLHNVASGLAFLHERSPPIIHRDLSAKNILLNSEMVAKIGDLGMACVLPHIKVEATMTKAPGASVYMPPEAIAPSASNNERSKYNASIDIFSFGVVTIFTIGETFPRDPLAHNYTDDNSGLLVARTELQRRSGYMRNVNTQLRACGQLRGDHPLIQLIQKCLQNVPAKRPNIREVLHLLEEARAGFRHEGDERNKQRLIQALQEQPRKQNLVCVIQDLVTENAGLQSRVQEAAEIQEKLAEAQQQLRTEEEQRESRKIQLARLWKIVYGCVFILGVLILRTVCTWYMGDSETEKYELMQAKNRELAKQLEQKKIEMQAKDRDLAEAKQQLKHKETEKNQAKDREQPKALQQPRQKVEPRQKETEKYQTKTMALQDIGEGVTALLGLMVLVMCLYCRRI